MGSVDSDIGYDIGSMHSDLSLLEDSLSLSEVVPANSSAPGVSPAPFMSARPANPAMAALTSQHREAHNRSPISFREGRRASDTSLTQGEPAVLSCRIFQTCHITHFFLSINIHFKIDQILVKPRHSCMSVSVYTMKT